MRMASFEGARKLAKAFNVKTTHRLMVAAMQASRTARLGPCKDETI